MSEISAKGDIYIQVHSLGCLRAKDLLGWCMIFLTHLTQYHNIQEPFNYRNIQEPFNFITVMFLICFSFLQDQHPALLAGAGGAEG